MLTAPPAPCHRICVPGGTKCKACNHPQRADIDSALVAGDSERIVANRHGLKQVAIHRHKVSHLGPRLARAMAKVEEQDESLAESILWSQRAAKAVYREADDAAVRVAAVNAHVNAANSRAKWVERLSEKRENENREAPSYHTPAEKAAALEGLIRDATAELERVRGKLS